ncbi:hypothetical protein QTH11_02885 [Clostridium perfringens]|nr:hypothetical protein [Clostridium perfringens]HAT4246205.1 hypothetical protein [Clostridium perfringens]
MFVPRDINTFMTNVTSSTRKYIGICEKKNGYKVKLKKFGKSTHVGTFKDEVKAYKGYCNARNEYAKELADEYKGKIEDRVYKALMNWNEGRLGEEEESKDKEPLDKDKDKEEEA